MKFCTTPNSKNIIETLRIVTIEKSELTFLEFNRVFESLCACIFFKNSSIVLKKFLYLLYIRRKEYSLNSIKPPICEILNIFFYFGKSIHAKNFIFRVIFSFLLKIFLILSIIRFYDIINIIEL